MNLRLKLHFSRSCVPWKSKKQWRIRTIVFAIHVFFLALVLWFILIKIINLVRDPNIKKFPNHCIPDKGCANVKVQGENHRDYEVDSSNLYTVNLLGVNNINDVINICVADQAQGRIEHSGETSQSPSLYHVNYSSIFWGFVDDMIIEIIIWAPRQLEITNTENSNVRALAVQVQSQLRMGSSDFGINPKRVANFYQCLNDNIPNPYKSGYGSLW